MTRKEEIKQASNISFKIRLSPRTSFIRGAEWADRHPREGLWDAEKVAEWIKQNYEQYIYNYGIDEVIVGLRKAMED